MKTKLEIVRFRTEDVIAASGLCQNYGTHLFVEGVDYVPENDSSTIIKYYGSLYDYSAEDRLVRTGDDHGEYRYDATSISLGYIRLEAGKWYRVLDRDPWKGILCIPQTH